MPELYRIIKRVVKYRTSLPVSVLQYAVAALEPGGGGVLYIFWVRGRAIGKGIDLHDFGIRNGIDFHDFGIRNGINSRNFRNWYRIGYAFSEIGIMSGIYF